MSEERVNQLLTDIGKGEKQAIARLYRENREKFINWSTRNYQLTNNEAMDIYQDTMVIFYHHVVSGKLKNSEAKLETYLFGIAKNLILKFFRNERKEVKGRENWLAYINEEETSTGLGYELEDKAREALKQLKEPCKTILTLFYYYNQSIEEIAKKVGHQDKNVTKTQKSRCLGYFREKYQALARYEYGG